MDLLSPPGMLTLVCTIGTNLQFSDIQVQMQNNTLYPSKGGPAYGTMPSSWLCVLNGTLLQQLGYTCSVYIAKEFCEPSGSQLHAFCFRCKSNNQLESWLKKNLNWQVFWFWVTYSWWKKSCTTWGVRRVALSAVKLHFRTPWLVQDFFHQLFWYKPPFLAFRILKIFRIN